MTAAFKLWPKLPSFAGRITLHGHVDIDGVRYLIEAWCVGESKHEHAHFEGTVEKLKDARQRELEL